MAENDIKSVQQPTYIHGIGSSQAIDTAGEIVDLAGLDCSSLVGGAFNWEHNSSVPASIVGKVLEYKKIFSEKDCENDHHEYFWDKCRTPFLYVMGRLFDDKKPSAQECAALFKDDAEHKDELPMVGFSVEGSKVDKKGIVVTKSIARKITVTGAPANKTCVAEMVAGPEAKQSADDSIFKSESSHTIELLEKAEVPGSKIKPAHHSSTHTPVKGAPGWQHAGGGNFQHAEHGIVSVVKQGNEFHVKHKGALAGIAGKKGVFGSSKEAGGHAGEYMSGLSHGKTVAPEMQARPSPNMAKAYAGPNPMITSSSVIGTPDHVVNPKPGDVRIPGAKTSTSSVPNKNKMSKSLSAGSGMAAPGNLSGGAALAKESLDKKMKKSQWLARAEEAYKIWEKREQFENFMAKHMPSLTRGEIQSIGQVLSLRKSLRAEKKLAKMIDQGQDSWVNKKES